jgi:hypothetical protein
MENIQLTRFLDTIRGEGFTLSLSWETKRWKKDPGGVRHYCVGRGESDRDPIMRTFIVTDFGPGDGYALYGDGVSSFRITADVAAVTGIPEDEISLVA